MTDQRPPSDEASADPSAMVAKRFAEYVDLWEGAFAKLTRSEYHAEDLLDDWFNLWGKCIRDATAASAAAWSARPDEGTRSSKSAEAPS